MIGVKYFPASTELEKQPFQKFEQMNFVLENNKITSIIYEI